MNWLAALRESLGIPPDAYLCPECEKAEGKRHHADCSKYPTLVVKP